MRKVLAMSFLDRREKADLKLLVGGRTGLNGGGRY